MTPARRFSDRCAADAAALLAPACRRKPLPLWPLLGLPAALVLRYLIGAVQ